MKIRERYTRWLYRQDAKGIELPLYIAILSYWLFSPSIYARLRGEDIVKGFADSVK